jgi:four helix bundle protein
MKFKYEELEIWQIALQLIKAIYKTLRKFPQEEKYDLVSQGKRAVTSIALNIAEGSGRHTDKDFSLFINRAITSLLEVDAVLKIGINLGYLQDSDYSNVEPIIKEEYFKLIAFDKTLLREPSKRRRYKK